MLITEERERGREDWRKERKKGWGGKEGNESNVHTYGHTRIAVAFESWSSRWSLRALGTLSKFQHQVVS